MTFRFLMALVCLIFIVACASADEPLDFSLTGDFILDVRTADDNEYIDWFNEHASPDKAWWKKLGQDEMEVFLYTKKEGEEQHWVADRGVYCGTQYQAELASLTKWFGEDLQMKYKGKKIVRAIDNVGFLKQFGITPKILNKHYVHNPPPPHVKKHYKSWWSISIPKSLTMFRGRSYADAFQSAVGLDKSKLMQDFRDSIVITYANGNKDKTVDNPFMLSLTPKNIGFSIACDVGQTVTISLKDGKFPSQRYVTFMISDPKDSDIFGPGDAKGAKLVWVQQK